MRGAAALILISAVIACDSPTLPGTAPGMVGNVVWVRVDADSNHLVHVKSDPAEECGIIFRVDDESVVFDSRGATSRRVARSTLVVGLDVAVWYGLLDTSCPGGSYATAIEIVS